MRYDSIEGMKPSDFRRLTGVQRATFAQMLSILEQAQSEAKQNQRYRGGRPPKLSLADQLLMTLEYLREYRTQFHIAAQYGIDESRCGRIIRRVEDTLMQSRQFTLPSRKALLESNTAYEVVLIDATETPIERPKKSKNTSTLERKSATR